VLFHAASAPFHASCAHLAASLPAIVASVDYRLAPEHRLPAAFDDARDALNWAQLAVSSDLWVRDFADPNKLFLMGSSAGANICYHAALDLISSSLDLSPLRLSGLILNQPYFGGIDRTASELALVNDKIIPLPANDLLWELALPLGADRDHEYCNVVAKEAKEAKLLPPCLVRGHIGDPLLDRQKLFVKMLKTAGVTVVVKMESPGHHGIELFKPAKAVEMAADVKNFVYGLGAEFGTPTNRPEHKL
jgi:acetyl esterase/lipase